MKHIVEVSWLTEHWNDADLVIADCRFVLTDPAAGRAAYEESHIPGAVYIDLDRQLSAPKGEHGGRHPLVDMTSFAAAMGQAGIGNSTTVVAYDDQGGAYASRLWWMLRYAGHERVYVLNGGFAGWQAAGGSITAEVPTPAPAAFEPHPREELLLSMADVRARLGDPNVVLIDSREEPRYLGLSEPIDPVAGHIPGAINRFWKGALDEQGRWRDAAGQTERFRDLDPAKELVVYCGSGVTACPNVLALEEAGFPNVKLYAGSWSDWISYEGNPVATGDEGKA
ncbi:sulfurtransferase [Paenibacillus koleovorans]|uniref:sulfurtransferase n=1 Tax=Paenibacillus koleovorans TaxID=121608 RepID=UPI000FD75A6E|nr:sulfurtransferase [Paenibacillus koleovorans]